MARQMVLLDRTAGQSLFSSTALAVAVPGPASGLLHLS